MREQREEEKSNWKSVYTGPYFFGGKINGVTHVEILMKKMLLGSARVQIRTEQREKEGEAGGESHWKNRRWRQ